MEKQANRRAPALCGGGRRLRRAQAEIAEEITWQMGRPISQAPGEVGGFEERARHMIAIAAEALADSDPDPKTASRASSAASRSAWCS